MYKSMKNILFCNKKEKLIIDLLVDHVSKFG